ncbi:glutamate dehydrogenase [Sulfolobales archaeon HS-7]|nr:glutamate dehydrogenase [Sulfolobales archaeon HS-7]
MEVTTEISASLLAQQLKILDKISLILGLDSSVREALATPERVIQVKIQVRDKSGKQRVYTGFRSQHNSALGPYKGGVRYSPKVNLEEVMALSMIMTWKNSLLKLPYGGGKGGINLDPRELDATELEKASRVFVREIYEYIGDELDIMAPDINTDSQTITWFMDEYERISRRRDRASFTGKPVELGGIATRVYSTGLGVANIAKLSAEKFIGGIEGKNVIIQGFGNVGSWTAKFLHEMGARIIGISDIYGGVINEKGINPNEALEYLSKTGTVANYPGRKVTNEELLLQQCDILIPAAVENVINKASAPLIKAKLVVEAANGPVTANADEILFSKGIPVIPDILTNSGGVVGSFVEWSNNRSGEIIDEDEAKRLILNRMKESFNSIYSRYEKQGEHNFRTIAMVEAVDRVVNAMRTRGQL